MTGWSDWLGKYFDALIRVGILIGVGFLCVRLLAGLAARFLNHRVSQQSAMLVNKAIYWGGSLLSVKMRTLDNKYIRIPNEMLVKTQFTNITYFPIRRFDLEGIEIPFPHVSVYAGSASEPLPIRLVGDRTGLPEGTTSSERDG